MTIIFAFILFLLVYSCLVFLAAKGRSSSILLPLIIAFPLFICFESLLLNVLSIFQAVTQFWMITVHVLFCVCVFIYALNLRLETRSFIFRLVTRGKCLVSKYPPSLYILLLLLLIVGMTTFLYVPNNYDSMTYHMARVAHWIQNGSIEYYRTHIARQNQMGPGAEYLILFMQIIAGSDRLANSIQFFSFLLIPIALYYLLRVIRFNRNSIPWVILLCMMTPMAVLQASSTQNDLVASLITLCIIATSIRLLVGNAERMSKGDVVLAALCCAAGFLVKPVTLIVAFPFILTGCLLQGKKLLKFMIMPAGRMGLIISLFSLVIVCGPDFYRKIGQGVFSRPEVYPLFSQWDVARIFNPLALVAPNYPFAESFRAIIRELNLPLTLYNHNVFNIHEDFIGNPIQMLMLLVVGGAALIYYLIRLLTGRRRNSQLIIIAILPLFAWIVFGWVVKNQGWITRLQLPLFFLLPFCLAWCFSSSTPSGVRKACHLMLVALTIYGSAYGIKIASSNPIRPMEARFFWGKVPSAFESYYRMADKKMEHNNFLRVAKELNCRRAYILIVPDYPEYPLTWRAMQADIEIRHAFREDVDSWPCMLFADGVKPKYVPDRGLRWIGEGDSHTLVRNLEFEFNQAEVIEIEMNKLLQGRDLLYEPETTTINYENDRVDIISNGIDPHIIFPGLANELEGDSVIKVIINSPAETILKIYYQTAYLENYSESESFSKKLHQGVNTIYFQLPGDLLTGDLRLDPGERPGVYNLINVEIRRIPDN